MLSSVIASFAPLVLLALPATAAPPGTTVIPIVPSKGPPGIIDLSPRITPNVTLFIDHQINFTSIWEIYDAEGKPIYTTTPVNDSLLSVSSVKYSDEVGWMNLGPSNCMGLLEGTVYLDRQASRNTNRWTIEDDTHKPDTFAPIFVHAPKAAPVGVIEVGPDNNGIIAQITDVAAPPPKLPIGKYYSIFLPADKGHDPFVSPIDSIVLVLTILQAQSQCATNILH